MGISSIIDGHFLSHGHWTECAPGHIRQAWRANVLAARPRGASVGELPASMQQPMQWNSKVQGSFKWTWFQGSKARLPPQWRFGMPDSTDMKDHVYKILELVGSSEKSIEDAIQNAVTRASKTIRDMKWFEVVQTRGHIEKRIGSPLPGNLASWFYARAVEQHIATAKAGLTPSGRHPGARRRHAGCSRGFFSCGREGCGSVTSGAASAKYR
jgi:dodecin